jgi:hypothetical protein
MNPHFPLKFTLDTGTHVVVSETGTGRYDFELSTEAGTPRRFTYIDGEKTKAEWDEEADYDQMEALRMFWLKTEGF